MEGSRQPVSNTRELIRQAVLAPSSHNTQPWMFRVSEAAIDVCADRSRALPVNDPDDRELVISCGCALMNIRVAAARRGLRAKVKLLPERERPERLARVVLGAESGASAPEGVLAEFVERRRTYRKAFSSGRADPGTLDELIEAARVEGASLFPLSTEEAKRQAAWLVAEGDAAQWANPRWRRELAAWMRPPRCGDGLNVSALAAPVARLVVRTFDMSRFVGAQDRQLVAGSPTLAALCTEGDARHDWVQAGQALQRVLLVACRRGLQASYLNQPIQVARLRHTLQELVGKGWPQILLRVGRPLEAIPDVPRRPADDVIVEDRTGREGPGREGVRVA